MSLLDDPHPTVLPSPHVTLRRNNREQSEGRSGKGRTRTATLIGRHERSPSPAEQAGPGFRPDPQERPPMGLDWEKANRRELGQPSTHAWRKQPATMSQTRLLRRLSTQKGLPYESPHDVGHASDQISLLLKVSYPQPRRPQRVGPRLVRNLNEVHAAHTA